MDCSSASEPDRVCEPGLGAQCPKERNPMLFTSVPNVVHVLDSVNRLYEENPPRCHQQTSYR
jgi:hypothetical protein